MFDAINRDETAALVEFGRSLRASGYRFVTPTPATHARVNARPGSDWARDLVGVMGWSRPFRHDAIDPGNEAAMRAAGIIEPAGEGWRSVLRASTLDDLLFLHSAYPTSDADSVFFGPDTYRFAQAIAQVVRRPVRRAVDIGCGAGPGAVLIARAHPRAEVLGLDINPAALRLTRVNAALGGVSVAALHSDILTDVEGEFDLIIANPPYMADSARRAYRDGGGPLGATLSLRIVQAATERLATGGTLLLYTGAAIVEGQDPFLAAATPLMTGLSWSYREIDPDVFGEELAEPAYARADRIAAVALVATKSG